MDKVIVERDVVVSDGGSSTGSNAIWAIAFVVIVAIIGGAVYYSGILKRVPGPASQKIDVKVTAPAAPAPANP